MWHSFKVFLFLPPLLFALDYIWLGIFASSLYKKDLGGFLRMSGDGMQPIIWAALVVYIAIPAASCCSPCHGCRLTALSRRASSGAGSSASWSTRSTT